VLRLAMRQSQKAASFADASSDLRELAGLSISPTHLQRLARRIGKEWRDLRDKQVEAFKEGNLSVDHADAPRGAVVQVDGGRLQTREDEADRGVHGQRWRESKVACCQTMTSSCHSADPQPDPPSKFLDPAEAARLAAEVKARREGGNKKARRPKKAEAKAAKPQKKKRRQKRKAPLKLVKPAVASMA